MIIPEDFCEKTGNNFGRQGEEWLARLPGIVEKCRSQWQLTDLEPLPDLTINLVCFAQSPQYGPVVLKVEGPHPERYTEMRALSLLPDDFICKCLAHDGQTFALLLERIVPGRELDEVDDLTKQMHIAGKLIVRMPTPLNDTSAFPTIRWWLDRAFARVRQEQVAPPEVLSLVDTAERYYAEIESLERPQMLLHGDLHHWNILWDRSGRWKAIDPHGVVGPAFMEAACFMNNHLYRVAGAAKADHLANMVAFFSRQLNESEKTIAQGFLTFAVLSICWMYEEENPDREVLSNAIEECLLIAALAQKLSTSTT